VVLVRAFPQELRAVENYLRETRLVVERQVMLEAKVIEVTLAEGFQSGINWALFRTHDSPRGAIGQVGNNTTLGTSTSGVNLSSGGITVNPQAGALATTATLAGNAGAVFGLAFQTSNFAALLQFLDSQGTTQVLSSPRIATLNNQKAVLKVGTDEFFVTNITTNQTTTTGGAIQNSPTITVQPFFSGVALDVTPQIDENDEIILHIHPSVSRVIDKVKDIDLGEAGTFRLPLASSDIRETDTIVRVRNGNIVAIGGLMTEASERNKSGLPWAGDIPVVGHAFKNTNRRSAKAELVILLKPTVIQGDDAWKQDLRDTRERMDGLEYTPNPPLWEQDKQQQGAGKP
jgi:MSHA biogenesis protein MshL